MLISLLQTLAEIMAGGTSLTSIEQIDFSLPGSRRDGYVGPLLNLYLYDIRQSKQLQQAGRQKERNFSEGGLQTARVNLPLTWIDVSLMLTAWDRTALGEYHLLNEALTLLLRHRSLREEFLVPELRGYGNLSMTVAVNSPVEISSLWSALSLPLRPALYLTVTAPLESEIVSIPLVWERIMSLYNDRQKSSTSETVMNQRVSVAGVIKSAVTSRPLTDTKVTVMGTEKSATSNQEGLFFFDNLRLGNYILTLNCSGYLPQNCNVLVDGKTYTFKEVLLSPEN